MSSVQAYLIISRHSSGHAPSSPARSIISPAHLDLPSCQKLMRVRAIEVANGEEQIKLACAACGAEAAQTNALSE
jgi:hypothetical protein